ncbi:hypothetical protein D9M68_654900 [compost metagenome]
MAGLHQQARLLQQALVIQAWRAAQRWQSRQGAQLVLAEHAFEALGLDRHQLAAGEFGEAVQVQQLAAREEHQEGANGVFKQHRLDPLRSRQPWMLQTHLKGQPELLE